jgi:serine/threonine protein kinase
MTTLLDIGAGRVVTVSTFYNAVELLGVGRYSEVYKAFDRNSQTDVALKLYVGFDEAAHSMAKAEEAMLSRIGALNSKSQSSAHRIRTRFVRWERRSEEGDIPQRRDS